MQGLAAWSWVDEARQLIEVWAAPNFFFFSLLTGWLLVFLVNFANNNIGSLGVACTVMKWDVSTIPKLCEADWRTDSRPSKML